MHEQPPMVGHGQPPMGHGPPPMGVPGPPVMGGPGQPPMGGQMGAGGVAPGMMGMPQQAPGMFPHQAPGQMVFAPHRPPTIAKGDTQHTRLYNILPMITFKVPTKRLLGQIKVGRGPRMLFGEHDVRMYVQDSLVTVCF